MRKVAGKARGMRLLLVAAACVAAILGFSWAGSAWKNPAGKAPPEGYEALRSVTAYRTSESCLRCHPDNHASWKRTFHRTMTQKATPDAVQAPFDGRTLAFDGVVTTVSQSGDEFHMRTTDPQSGELRDFLIAMTVGSRRIQQYVTYLPEPETVRLGGDIVTSNVNLRLPWAWSMEEKRWFHLSEAFFHPEGAPFHEHTAYWDLNCVFCHNVKAKPNLAAVGGTARVATEVAELGIACEACHGPGDEHERRMSNPLRRFAFEGRDIPDPTVVNPARLDKTRSVQVCGHCHGQRLPADQTRIMEFLSKGDPYTAGEDLLRHVTPIRQASPILTAQGEVAGTFAPRFWLDGSVRLSAYEMQALTDSACFKEGSLTCVSCHAMHDGDPRGMMRPDKAGAQMCLPCHAEYTGQGLAGHTRHDPKGPGSDCMSCHMPEVVYGIMSWHPTHDIRIPDPSHSARYEMPDACTLCHTGKSIAWAEREADRLWPQRRAEHNVLGPEQEMAEIPRALVAGDPVYRTLAAHALGRPGAPEPETRELAQPLLAYSLLDNYPNVRRTARLSLAALTGRSDLPVALEPAPKRQAVWDAFLRRTWFAGDAPAGWPFVAGGQVDQAQLETWRAGREEVPFAVGE